MNKVIKALFIQAGGTVEEENGNLWTYSDNFDPEKFGQLVLRECINACGSDFGTEYIKKHFGVKE